MPEPFFDRDLLNKLRVLNRKGHLQSNGHQQVPVVTRERQIAQPRTKRHNAEQLIFSRDRKQQRRTNAPERGVLLPLKIIHR